MIQFHQGQGDVTLLKPSGRTLNVTIGPGLPSSTSELLDTLHAPCNNYIQSDVFVPFHHVKTELKWPLLYSSYTTMETGWAEADAMEPIPIVASMKMMPQVTKQGP